MVLSERINIAFHEDESEVSLSEKIAEKLYDMPQLITKLLQQEAIEFLLQCWDMEGESLIAEMYAREIEQLHFLGFLSYEDDTILLNMEAKDNFFFSLKSRRVQEELEEGTRLENILFGMLFLYGILDIYECCQMIQEEMFPELTYDELEEFILLRIVFWQSGILLRNQMNSRLLLASREVENRNEVFIQWSLREDLSWKRYSEDEYKNLALGNGIGGWDGIPELYDFVMKNIENDQYKVMMIVKSLVVKIQNGLTYEEITSAYVNLLDEELSRYPVALGIAIVDENACDVQFDLAADSEIPIVAFDSGSDYQGLMATVSTNNSESAQVVADNLGKELEGTGEIVVVANDSKSKNNKERVNAFAAKLQESYPEISIVDTVYLDALDSWQEKIAAEINAGTYALSGEPTGTALSEETQVDPKSITEEQVLDYVLKKHPNLKGVYGTNQVAVKALVEGIERGEREGLKVVGYDADEEQLQMLKDGTVDGLLVQNPFGMGYASVIAAARAAIGAGNESYVNTGYVWVTKDNMKNEEVKQMLAE